MQHSSYPCSEDSKEVSNWPTENLSHVVARMQPLANMNQVRLALEPCCATAEVQAHLIVSKAASLLPVGYKKVLTKHLESWIAITVSAELIVQASAPSKTDLSSVTLGTSCIHLLNTSPLRKDGPDTSHRFVIKI
jgi:hypothetical protein